MGGLEKPGMHQPNPFGKENKLNRVYKGSAPRAAEASRHARAREISTKCEGGRKKRPMI